MSSPHADPLRIAVVLPGLHRVCRGAEVAFESVATELAAMPDTEVTLFGSGERNDRRSYRFVHVPCVPRERFERLPSVPLMRSEYVWEEMTFAAALFRSYRGRDFDVSVTCSFPFVHWFLRASGTPAHVYVTQNGDHAPSTRSREYRFFSCDGLVCTNPEYFERNNARWFSRLIPNGVDPAMFSPGPSERSVLGLPDDVPLALSVSALIRSKRVDQAIRACSEIPGMHLLVCGDGPERDRIVALGAELMGGRFHHRTFRREQMPGVYRSADVFLHMSVDEPSANVYIEALATGLPIVTHDRSVTRWTLEETSVLVDATQTDAVSHGVKRGLELRSHNAVHARVELAKSRFSWAAIAGEYRKFLLEVCARGRKPRP